ncbi:MAG: hypothetical protein ACYDBY_19830 [Thermoanaerobaculia bacterium]
MTAARFGPLLAPLAAGAILLSGALPAHAWDVDALVLEAAARQREGEVAAGRIALDRIEVETELDAGGRRKKSERRRYAVVMDRRGLAARELVEVDGRAATADERDESRRKEEKRRRASLEPGGARSDEEELLSGRVPLLDLYHRLDFRLLREERLDGRPTFVVAFRPKPGLVAKTIRDRVLNAFAGTAWIDVAEIQVRKIDGRLTKPVRVLGGALLEVKGVRLLYETREVLPGLWAPCREEISITATAGMVLPYRRELRFEFSSYRPEPGAEGIPRRHAERVDQTPRLQLLTKWGRSNGIGSESSTIPR